LRMQRTSLLTRRSRSGATTSHPGFCWARVAIRTCRLSGMLWKSPDPSW
jgi:hypothetical protein